MVFDKYKSKSYDDNFNLVLFASLVLAGLGVGWLALNGIEAGTQYTIIFLVLSVMFLLGFTFIKESDSKFLNKFIKSPLSTDYDIAVPLFIIGWIMAFVFNYFLTTFSSFNIAQVMVPMSASQIDNTILQSFSAVEVSADPFWRWFITVFTAGTIEEFGWGIAMMFIMYLLGMFILRMINDGKDLSFMKAETFYFWFAMIMSMVTFSGVHAINGSYEGTMFLIAVVFRVIMNLSIYAWGFVLSFTMGYHQSNNAIWFWYVNGPSVTYAALFSLKGLIVMSLFVLMIFYTLRRFPVIVDKFKKAFAVV